MSKELKKSLMVQGSILAAAGILTKIIGFVYRIPVANLLGNEGNGLYSVAYGIYNLCLVLSSMSLPTAVSKVVSARLAKKEYANAAHALALAFLIALVMGAASFALLFFGADALEMLYGRPGLAQPLHILAPMSFLFALLGVMRGYTQGERDMVPTALSQIIDQCFNAVVSVLAAWTFVRMYAQSPDLAAWGATGSTLGSLSGAVASFVLLVIIMGRRLPGIRKNALADGGNATESRRQLTRILLATIAPIVLSQTVYQIGYTLDDLIFGRFMNATELSRAAVTSIQGVFNTQYNQMVNLPVAIATAMAMTLMPNIVAANVSGDGRAVRRTIDSTLKFNMVIAIPCAVGLAVLAEPMMTLLFPGLGEYHTLAVRLLQTGSSAAVFYALSTLTTSILQGTNHMRLPVYHSAVSLAIHVGLLLVLLAAGCGVWALLIGNVTFPLLVCLLNCRSVGKKLHYRFNGAALFAVPALCAAGMGLACRGVYALLLALTHSVIAAFVPALVVAVAVYGLLVLKFHCFSKKELLELPLGRRILRLAVRLHL